MTKKTTAKKVAAPKVIKPKKITLKDDTLYAVSRRDGIFGWSVAGVYETLVEANAAARAIENDSFFAGKGAKITRTKLIRGSAEV